MSKSTDLPKLSEKAKELRAFYEADLFAYMCYVNPGYMYDDIHKEVAQDLQDGDREHVLSLLPRGHLKSHMLACYASWMLTKKPWLTCVYLTAGEDLATVQMSAIKQMFESEEYKLLWPEMFHVKESMRNKWSTWAINLDHPERAKRRIRDFSVIIKTIGSSATGLHCDLLLLDDIVVQTNAYTDAGRKSVEDSVADYIAIKNTGAITRAVGTLYDEKDIWHQFMDAEIPTLDEEGEVISLAKQWWIIKREVESRGDGLGTFLWPRVKDPVTGSWFGFDRKELIKKKVEYASLGRTAQFYSQYYNNTNHSVDGEKIEFQYYNRKNLSRVGDTWYIGEKKLLVTAGMDLAWTDEKSKKSNRSDYSAIAVVGIDDEGYVYLLDIIRFRTSKYSVYYQHITKLYDVWRFRKIFIESESAGKLIAEEMQDRIRESGDNYTAIAKPVPRSMSKEERISMILEPKYTGNTIKHYKGGFVPELEQELRETRPKFDDLKDALATAVKNAKKPAASGKTSHSGARRNSETSGTENRIASRFGGRRR